MSAPRLQCNRCGKKFIDSAHLNRHLQIKNPCSIHCKQCGNIFADLQLLTDHTLQCNIMASRIPSVPPKYLFTKPPIVPPKVSPASQSPASKVSPAPKSHAPTLNVATPAKLLPCTTAITITYEQLSTFVRENSDIIKFSAINTAAVNPDGSQDNATLDQLYDACTPYLLKLYMRIIKDSYEDASRRNIYLRGTTALVYVSSGRWEVHPINEALWTLYLAAKHGVDAAYLIPKYGSIPAEYAEAIGCMQFYCDEQLMMARGKDMLIAFLAQYAPPHDIIAASTIPARPLIPKPKKLIFTPTLPDRQNNDEDVVTNSPIGNISAEKVAKILHDKQLLRMPNTATTIQTIFNTIMAVSHADKLINASKGVREAAYYHLDKKIWEVCSTSIGELDAEERGVGLQLSKLYNDGGVSAVQSADSALPGLLLLDEDDARKKVATIFSSSIASYHGKLTWMSLLDTLAKIIDPVVRDPLIAAELLECIERSLLAACGHELNSVQSNIIQGLSDQRYAMPAAGHPAIPKIPRGRI